MLINTIVITVLNCIVSLLSYNSPQDLIIRGSTDQRTGDRIVRALWTTCSDAAFVASYLGAHFLVAERGSFSIFSGTPIDYFTSQLSWRISVWGFCGLVFVLHGSDCFGDIKLTAEKIKLCSDEGLDSERLVPSLQQRLVRHLSMSTMARKQYVDSLQRTVDFFPIGLMLEWYEIMLALISRYSDICFGHWSERPGSLGCVKSACVGSIGPGIVLGYWIQLRVTIPHKGRNAFLFGSEMLHWPTASFRLRERSFCFDRKCDFGERIIPLTGGDVLLYGSDVSNATFIWIIRNSLRTSCRVDRDRDMELSSLVEFENRNRMFGMEIFPGEVSFSILRHIQTTCKFQS